MLTIAKTAETRRLAIFCAYVSVSLNSLVAGPAIADSAAPAYGLYVTGIIVQPREPAPPTCGGGYICHELRGAIGASATVASGRSSLAVAQGRRDALKRLVGDQIPEARIRPLYKSLYRSGAAMTVPLAGDGYEAQSLAGSSDPYIVDLGRTYTVADAEVIAAQWRTHSDVAWAHPDYTLRSSALPNDPRLPEQWHLSAAGGGANWFGVWDSVSQMGDPRSPSHVRIHVLDSGRTSHEDLQPALGFVDTGDATSVVTLNGVVIQNACGMGTPVYPSSWHGTKVQSVINATINNGRGIASAIGGLAGPAISVYHHQATGSCGGSISMLANALREARFYGVSPGMNIVNMSLQGGDGLACPLAFVNEMASAGSRFVFVASSGNTNGGPARGAINVFPGNCPGVVAVTGVDKFGAIAYYAEQGSNVFIAAPAGDKRSLPADGILGATNAGRTRPTWSDYGHFEGTSYAAPQVSAILALMSAYRPITTRDELLAILRQTAKPVFASQGCIACGAGRLDAAAAMYRVFELLEADRRYGINPPNCQANPASCR